MLPENRPQRRVLLNHNHQYWVILKKHLNIIQITINKENEKMNVFLGFFWITLGEVTMAFFHLHFYVKDPDYKIKHKK